MNEESAAALLDGVTVGGNDLCAALAENVRGALDRSGQITRRSRIVVEASRLTRDVDRLVGQCAWCSKVRVGELWVPADEVPSFLVSGLHRRRTHGICPECFEAVHEEAGGNRAQPRTRVLIHAGDRRATECLYRTLAEYAVVERPRFVLEATLPDGGSAAVNTILTRVASCLATYQLDPVTIELADQSYTLAAE